MRYNPVKGNNLTGRGKAKGKEGFFSEYAILITFWKFPEPPERSGKMCRPLEQEKTMVSERKRKNELGKFIF